MTLNALKKRVNAQKHSEHTIGLFAVNRSCTVRVICHTLILHNIIRFYPPVYPVGETYLLLLLLLLLLCCAIFCVLASSISPFPLCHIVRCLKVMSIEVLHELNRLQWGLFACKII